MTTPVYQTATHALVAGAVPTDYGSIVPAQQFDFIDVFVDPGGVDGTLILEVFGKAGAAGVVFTAGKATIRTGKQGPTTVAIPQIEVIGSTIYDLQVSSPDTNFPAVKCTMAGYNRQDGNPDEIVDTTVALVQGVEVPFGTLNSYHTYVQASVDFGPNPGDSEAIWRLYGTADVAGGGVRTLISEQRTKPGPNGTGFGQLVINLPEQFPVHFTRDQSDDFRTIGVQKYELTAEGLFPFDIVLDSHPHATLVGFDPNCACEGVGATGPTGPTGPSGQGPLVDAVSTANMVGGSGTAAFISGPSAVSPTNNSSIATARFYGFFEGVVGQVTVDGVVSDAKFTTVGGAPANGAPVYLAATTDDGGTGAGKLTATVPIGAPGSGIVIAEVGICKDDTNYAGGKTSAVLIQPKAPIIL